MVRQKAQGATTLKSWADADTTLRKIGDLTREIEKKERAATERIEAVKAKLQMDTAKQIAEKTALLHDLEAFALLHKTDLVEEAGRKSIDLNHGRLGFRKSTTLKAIKKIADAVQWIKDARLAKKYLRIKESLNKEAMRELSDTELADIGMKREVKDVFWCEPNETTAKPTPKSAA